MYLNKKIERYILIYLIILVSIPVISDKLRVLLLPVCIYYVFLINRYNQYKREILLILVLMTPLSILKPYYTLGIDITQLFIFMYIANIVLRFIIFKKKRIKVDLELISILFYMILGMILLNFIISRIDIRVKFVDFRNYIIIVLIYIIFSKYFNIKRFFELVLYGLTLSSFITLIIYFLGDINHLGLLAIEGRYTWGYQTLYIISIPIIMFFMFQKDKSFKNKAYYIFSIIVQVSGLLLGQNRTAIILVLFNLLFVFITMLIIYLKSKKNKLKIILLIFLNIVILISLIFAINNGIKNNSEVITRFLDVMNKTGTIDNITTRNNTNMYYIEAIKNKLLGYGIGSKMYMYNENNSPYQLGYFIDNAFITMAYKLGVAILGIIILIILGTNIILIKKRNKGFILLYSLVSVNLVAIAGGMMTAQIINNNAVSFFFWALIGVIKCNNYRVKGKNE